MMFLSTPITSLVVAAHLLLHAVLGCCWHHAHSCEVDGCEHPAAVTDAHSCDGHAHEGHAAHQHSVHSEPAQEESPQNCPAPRHRCEGRTCVFIGNNASAHADQIDGADACWPIAADALPAIALSQQVQSLNQPPTALPPPLRPHLYLQILLI